MQYLMVILLLLLSFEKINAALKCADCVKTRDCKAGRGGKFTCEPPPPQTVKGKCESKECNDDEDVCKTDVKPDKENKEELKNGFVMTVSTECGKKAELGFSSECKFISSREPHLMTCACTSNDCNLGPKYEEEKVDEHIKRYLKGESVTADGGHATTAKGGLVTTAKTGNGGVSLHCADCVNTWDCTPDASGKFTCKTPQHKGICEKTKPCINGEDVCKTEVKSDRPNKEELKKGFGMTVSTECGKKADLGISAECKFITSNEPHMMTCACTTDNCNKGLKFEEEKVHEHIKRYLKGESVTADGGHVTTPKGGGLHCADCVKTRDCKADAGGKFTCEPPPPQTVKGKCESKKCREEEDVCKTTVKPDKEKKEELKSAFTMYVSTECGKKADLGFTSECKFITSSEPHLMTCACNSNDCNFGPKYEEEKVDEHIKRYLKGESVTPGGGPVTTAKGGNNGATTTVGGGGAVSTGKGGGDGGSTVITIYDPNKAKGQNTSPTTGVGAIKPSTLIIAMCFIIGVGGMFKQE